jgi:hypothetical protein
MVVKLQEIPGTQSKNPIFNSVAKILKLRKSIENHRNIITHANPILLD